MRVRSALLAILLIGLVPSLANALALGEIRLNSGLNEVLDAEIAILSATPEEIENLSAAVAARETFERYGLDRPDFLSSLRFRVDKSGAADVLRVYSTQPISEPFVTFLVEAQWRRGRLLREYTVLLDPPVFLPTPERSRPAPVMAPRSVQSQSQPSAGQIVRDVPTQPRLRPARVYAGTPSFGSSYGPILRNETLWGIAERLRTDNSITMNQMMIAIYQANQDAFLGNINLMKEGSVLRIPDRAAIEAVAQPEAFSIAVAHNEAWRAGRPSQVAVAGTAPSRVTPSTPDTSRLRLVEPDEAAAVAGADSRTGTGVADDAATRETLAQNEATIERLSSENDQLRSDLEEIRRLLNVRDGALAELQQQLATDDSGPVVSADTTVDGTTDTATDEVSDTDETVAATIEGGEPAVVDDTAPVIDSGIGTETVADTSATEAPAVTTPVVETQPQEPGFFARAMNVVKSVFGSLWLWVGVGLALLAAFAMFVLRGRGAEEQDAIEALTREARESAPEETVVRADKTPSKAEKPDVEFFEDSGTFKPVDFTATQASDTPSGEYPFEDTVGGEIKLDQSDPLAEADFHMAYGLYDQASDLVKKAIDREPKRMDLRMKLLEIFFVWGNGTEFRATAEDLRTNMAGEIAEDWDKIVIMGKQICPDDELFAGDAAIGTSADIDLDFEPGEATSAVDLDTGGDQDIDLDIGGALGAVPGDEMGQDERGSLDTVDEMLDFNLGDEEPLIDDDETRPEPVEEIKDQIRARLSSTDTDETAEMDLSDLGVDLDLAGSSGGAPAVAAVDKGRNDDDFSDEGTAVDFGDVFETPPEQSDPTSELPAATTELTSGAGALDLDIGSMFGELDNEDDEETARDLASLEESMEETGAPLEDPMAQTGAPLVDDAGDTGHFSAEVETLHGDSLDVDITAFRDDEADNTRLIQPDEDATTDATGELLQPDESSATAGDSAGDFADEDIFSQSVFEDIPVDETKLIGPDDDLEANPEDSFSAAIFGEDETIQVPASDESPDVDADGLDLDIGSSLPEHEDMTTAKVATSDLALPDSGDELSEVGTKLDLARAYMDMGDPAGARGILEEVLAEGNEGQQADARELLSNLG